ncbi:MAG: HEAT repeat domain-containing protein [Kofleriaceae bacterium]|nr:HEAT repeat domain-containing protein [Kofleriaceae bacterium]
MQKIFLPLFLSCSIAAIMLSSACKSPGPKRVHNLSESDERKAITIVNQGLRDNSPELKLRALTIASRQKEVDYGQSVRPLLTDSHEMVASASALYLHNSTLHADGSADKLAEQYLQSSSEHVRAFMLAGIARTRGSSSRALVLSGLSDKSARVRRVAVAAMGSWRQAEDWQRLVATAQSDSSPRVRSSALRALLHHKQGDEGLIASALKDSYVGARLAGIALLNKFGEDTSLQELRSLAMPGDFPTALSAAAALYQRNKADMSELLSAALQSPDWETRASALNAATRCAPRQYAIKMAILASADTNVQVSLTAARLLRRLGEDTRASATFQLVLRSETLADRLSAAVDLAIIGDANAMQLLSQLSMSGSTAQRIAAIDLQRSSRVVSEGLLASLSDPELEIRLAAADALLSR